MSNMGHSLSDNIGSSGGNGDSGGGTSGGDGSASVGGSASVSAGGSDNCQVCHASAIRGVWLLNRVCLSADDCLLEL